MTRNGPEDGKTIDHSTFGAVETRGLTVVLTQLRQDVTSTPYIHTDEGDLHGNASVSGPGRCE